MRLGNAKDFDAIREWLDDGDVIKTYADNPEGLELQTDTFILVLLTDGTWRIEDFR
jgi:hypothetical protein